MKITEIIGRIRSWKLRVFKDWQWDLAVGGLLSLIALPINEPWLVLALPFTFTTWNQIYNKLFEPKDFLLRMAIPALIFMAYKLLQDLL